MKILSSKIEDEAIDKLVNCLKRKYKLADTQSLVKLLKKVELKDNRGIHKFVISINNLTKEIETETKVSLQKIQSTGSIPKVNLVTLRSSLRSINLSEIDRLEVYEIILSSLTNSGILV